MSFLNIKEVQDLKGVQQSPAVHPEGDAFEHTKIVVEYLMEHSDDELLILAGALHDIGKASTTKVGASGRIQAYGHEKVGAQMVPAICQRKGVTPAATEKIQWLVRHHMYPHREGEISAKKWNKVVNHPWYPDLVLLADADAQARKVRR